MTPDVRALLSLRALLLALTALVERMLRTPRNSREFLEREEDEDD